MESNDCLRLDTGQLAANSLQGNHSGEELFHHLMGFNSFGIGYFEDMKYRPFIAIMTPEYYRWTAGYFPHPKAIASFASFLTSASAEDNLRKGIEQLAGVSARFEDWHWRDHHRMGSALRKLLKYDWLKNSRQIINDAATRQSFSTILKSMTDRQISRAMDVAFKGTISTSFSASSCRLPMSQMRGDDLEELLIRVLPFFFW